VTTVQRIASALDRLFPGKRPEPGPREAAMIVGIFAALCFLTIAVAVAAVFNGHWLAFAGIVAALAAIWFTYYDYLRRLGD
jgi:hypothetical protein